MLLKGPKLKLIPEFGLERVPDESLIAPLLLRVIPMHPPILKLYYNSAFQYILDYCHSQFHMLHLTFSHFCSRGWACNFKSMLIDVSNIK